MTGELAGTDATLDDLVRTGIVRSTPAGYVIGFNYFTLADMRASCGRLIVMCLRLV